MFNAIDKNGNGLITKDEFILGMNEFSKKTRVEINPDDAVKLF